jgi:type IV fimbrial biogenesis protein FimT
MNPHAGVSLTELLLAIALLSLVAGFSVPAFHSLRLDAERSWQVNQFLQSIHAARAEAMKRGGVVSLCPSLDARTCAAPGVGWETGWVMFQNLDRDAPAVLDPGEPVVQSHPGWSAGQVHANRATLSFRAFGQSGVTATFTFCDSRGGGAARAVIISQTGRPRIATRTADGSPLDCG